MRLYDTKTIQRVEVDEDTVAKALEDGLVPSVTQVLDILNHGNHLIRWMIKNALNHYEETGDIAAALEFQDTTGSDYGTICHNLAEKYLEGKGFEEVEHKETHLKTTEPFFRWVDENVESVVFTETFFADAELRYGGTADFLLRLKKNGELLLGDMKVKKHSAKYPMKPSLDYKYQLSAYRNHFKKQHGEMQIGNFLLANPNNKFYTGKPLLLPYIYCNQDWTKGFEAAKMLWYEKYENE